jgi:ketosteroid isomerase-like protein
MSQENVEVMRRLVEATAVGDYETAVADLDSDVEIDDTDIPESTGADSFRQWLSRWDEIWESWRIESLELLPSNEDKVLALFRMIAKGKGSGIELERDDALLGEFRDGKIIRLGYYNDQQRAREAAGLSE